MSGRLHAIASWHTPTRRAAVRPASSASQLTRLSWKISGTNKVSAEVRRAGRSRRLRRWVQARANLLHTGTGFARRPGSASPFPASTPCPANGFSKKPRSRRDRVQYAVNRGSHNTGITSATADNARYSSRTTRCTPVFMGDLHELVTSR